MAGFAYRKFEKLPINGKQKTVINLALAFFGIDRETHHDMLEKRFGVRSTTRLNFKQASEYIAEFEKKGFHIDPSKGKKKPEKLAKKTPARPPISRTGGKVIPLATRDELEKVDQLAQLIEWRVENGLQLFLEKRMKIKGGKIRTSQDAYLAIEGLKKMFENGMKAKHGEGWWVMEFLNPAIREYIRIHRPAEWR